MIICTAVAHPTKPSDCTFVVDLIKSVGDLIRSVENLIKSVENLIKSVENLIRLDFFRVVDQLLPQLSPQLVDPLRVAGHLVQVRFRLIWI